MLGFALICSAYTGHDLIYPWKVYPRSGLKLFSISLNNIDIVSITTLKAFIFYKIVFISLSKINGTASSDLQ